MPGKGAPAVNKDKIRFAQFRVIKHRLKQKWITTRRDKIISCARVRMDMDGHSQTPRFASDIIEDEILQQFIFIARGFAAMHITGIYFAGVSPICLFKIKRTQISGFEFYSHTTPLSLGLERSRHDLLQIFLEFRWQC